MREHQADRALTVGAVLAFFVMHVTFGRNAETVTIGMVGTFVVLPWVEHYRARAAEV